MVWQLEPFGTTRVGGSKQAFLPFALFDTPQIENSRGFISSFFFQSTLTVLVLGIRSKAMHLLTAITFVLITFSTAQDLTAGEKCDSSTDCYGSADCLGESYDEKYCCDSDVEYSCDGCRYGDGKCDYCPQYGSSVSIDKLSCTSADSKLAAGAPCTSDSKCSSYECKGDRTKSGSRHCCDSSVGYSCAACDSTGLCNQCDTGTLSADKKSCDIELKDIGDYCDTDSQCKNSCAKSSSSYSSSSSSSRCCAENVLYSCDGCDSNGLCN